MDLNSCRDGTLFPCQAPPPRLIIDAITTTHAAVLVLHHALDKWSTFIKSIRIIRFGVGRPRRHSHVRGAKDLEKIARQRSCGGKLMSNRYFRLKFNFQPGSRRHLFLKRTETRRPIITVVVVRRCRRRHPSSSVVVVAHGAASWLRLNGSVLHTRGCVPLSSRFSPTRVGSCRAAPRRAATALCGRIEGARRRTSIPLLDIWRACTRGERRPPIYALLHDATDVCVRNITRVRITLPVDPVC